jgi:hypothetical protein
MTVIEIASHAVAFLLGAATGATGTYFADKYTDKQRRQFLAALVFWDLQNSTPSVLPTCFPFPAHPQGRLHNLQAASQIVFSQSSVFKLSPGLVNLGRHL